MNSRPRPMVLTVLDGWGYSENPDHNAIMSAATPNWDALWSRHARGLIDTSGTVVGLPHGQMGNSEVGHLNLGAGRVVHQDYTRITQAIEDGSFAGNETLVRAIERAQASGTVHVFGLMSPGGVHSHEEHIHALIKVLAARGVRKVCVHAMLDGRDMPPRSAGPSLKRMEDVCKEAGVGRVASICGRYYAMDRDKRWDRVQRAWQMYVHGEAPWQARDPQAALAAAYERDESDEFVQPTIIGADPNDFAPVSDGDVVIFMNYRADRARQLSHAFVDTEFAGFDRGKRPKLADYVTLTQYEEGLPASVLYPPVRLDNTLGAYASALGLTQLRIAETEKYAHVTFFFNGGEEAPFAGEDRVLVPSPKVATYDLQPEMSAPELTEQLVTAISSGKYDLIISNYANADMVGHSGNFGATVKAIEALDDCIGKVAKALEAAGGEWLITADHGNAEMMSDPQTGQTHTAHTTNPVPLLYMGRKGEVSAGGALADVAPTMLALMGIDQPAEMTGRPLITLET